MLSYFPATQQTDLRLLSLLEERLLALLLGSLVLGEVTISGNLLHNGAVDAAEIDLLAGGNNVAGVDAAEGNTVGLEGAGNEEDSLVEGLEEYNALAAEASGEEDEDGAGCEGGAELGRADSLASLLKMQCKPFIRVSRSFLIVCVRSWRRELRPLPAAQFVDICNDALSSWIFPPSLPEPLCDKVRRTLRAALLSSAG